MGPGLFTGLSLAVGKDEQGAAAGILVSSYAAGFLINPLTGMQLFIINVNFPYYLAIVLMFFCLLIAFFDKRLNRVVEYKDNVDLQSPNGWLESSFKLNFKKAVLIYVKIFLNK